MKKFLVIVAAFLMSTVASASDVAIEIGVRSQSGDVDTPKTAKSQLGFQGGATAALEISGPWFFRTGMLYTQRPLTVENGGIDNKYNMNYLDVPATVLYKFEDYAGVFGGINLALLFDKSCSGGCTVEKSKSMLTPITFGATFKFAPQFGGTLYFESASGEAAQGLENLRAIGVNVLVTFE